MPTRIRRPPCAVGGAKSRHEAATFVEPVNARIGAAALHQDLIAILLPGIRKGCSDHGATVAAALEVGMGCDILENAKLTAATQKIGRGDEHAGRDDLGIRVGYEDGNPFARQHLGPDLFGACPRFRAAADVGGGEQSE